MLTIKLLLTRLIDNMSYFYGEYAGLNVCVYTIARGICVCDGAFTYS